MSKLANFENKNEANSVRIQTLINFNFDKLHCEYYTEHEFNESFGQNWLF